MSFFKDVAKGFKKAQRKISKLTKPLRPAIAQIPFVGKATVSGLEKVDTLVAKEAKKKGLPPGRVPTPIRGALNLRLFGQTIAAAQRIAKKQGIPPQAQPAPISRPPVPTRVTPAFTRPIPRPIRRPVSPAVIRPTVIQELQPIGGPPVATTRRLTGPVVKATAARFGFKVPKQLQDPIGLAKDVLPFEFGRGAMQPQAAMPIPLSENTDKFGRALVVAPQPEARVRCPPGYVSVTFPDGTRACVLRGPAIAAKLWKPRKKPLISVKETRALQMATRAQKKIDRVHKRFGSKPRPRRRMSK